MRVYNCIPNQVKKSQTNQLSNHCPLATPTTDAVELSMLWRKKTN